MSMPIQRQSEQFGVFDSGPRWERDRSQHDLPKGLAGLVNSMGPRITSGMLNTRTAGWNYPEFDRTDIDDYDHDLDRPSAADFAEEDFERERKRNYPRGQGPAWNYDEDGDPDPYLEHLEETSDPERFISGSRRRLAVEEDYSGGDEDDPDWIRENSPRQQEHNRKRGEEISRSKEMFGSRHPFDRAAAARLAKDGECTCWEGYERVPGTEPCSEDSCRKKSMRLAGAGVDDRDVRPGPLVDSPLYEQDPDDFFGRRPYSGPHCPDCGKPMRWVSGPTCRHGNLLVDASWLNGKPDHTDVSWEETGDGWSHPATGAIVSQSEKYPGEWQMTLPADRRSRRTHTLVGHHPDPRVLMDSHDWSTGYGPPPSWHGDAKWWHRALPPALPPHSDAPRIAAVQSYQAPIAGGYLPGHQVYSLWRGEPRHGIVTALEAPNTVWVRYHDGQHLPENPGDIQLR